MFTHFSIDHTGRDDYDTDMALEYEDKETYNDFKTFYNDVLPEFKKFGKVIQFKVCSNHEPHLRGNVYIQYSNVNEAVDTYNNFNGRYYAGKLLTCEFSHVIKWRSAICGLYFRKQCPKGINCNFLHVFKNPSDEFWEADRDLPTRESYSHRNYFSRSNSDRYSSHHKYSSEHRHSRDVSTDYRSDFYHRNSSRHRRSSGSDNDSDDRNYSKSNRHKYKDNNESTRSHKRKHLDSSSYSPDTIVDSENSKHKKSKHKKKKKKKSKRKSSEDSETD